MFRIDLRSLAAFRIGVACVVIWDLIVRSFDLEAHYTDIGILPRTLLIDNFLSQRPYLCLHILHGSTQFQIILFGIAGLCAAALLVGYRTRTATVATWFLTCSLQARNPLINHGGDDILRLLLFWSMFVPLGGTWSIDRARASEVDTDERSVSNWGTAGLMLQLCFMYLFSGLLKSHPYWRREGTAVYLALSINQFTTPLGRALLPYHRLLTLLTFGTIALEITGPVLALFTYTRPRLRTLIVASFILFHIGLGICIELGIFPWICIAAWLAFIPAEFWDTVERRYSARSRRIPGLLLPRVVRVGAALIKEIEPRPLQIRLSLEGNAIAAFFLCYIFLWNLRAGDFNRFVKVFPRRLNGIGETARIDQYWNLFAPFPSLDHGWYVLDARLRDGSEVDLLTGRPVTWDRPTLISATYVNERWRKYLMNLWTDQFASYRPQYADYVHRKWNDTHPATKQIAHLEVCFMLETALPNYQVSPLRRVRLWTQDWQ